jgi:hypothetical protein
VEKGSPIECAGVDEVRVPVTGRSIAVAPHPSSDSLRVTLRSVLMRNRVRPSLGCRTGATARVMAGVSEQTPERREGEARMMGFCREQLKAQRASTTVGPRPVALGPNFSRREPGGLVQCDRAGILRPGHRGRAKIPSILECAALGSYVPSTVFHGLELQHERRLYGILTVPYSVHIICNELRSWRQYSFPFCPKLIIEQD